MEDKEISKDIKKHIGKDSLLAKKSTFPLLLEILFFIFFLLVGLYRINEHNAPIVLMDEFGYWVSGGFFGGKDWTSISSNMAYYSYGYGLVLALLIRLFSNGFLLYKSAIILNSLLLGLTFLLIADIGKCLYGNTLGKYTIICISFITCLYPTFLSNVHIAWSETMLLFLFSLNTWTLTRYSCYKKMIYLIVFVISNVYLYAVHQRSLGILLSCFLALIYLLVSDIKKVKKYIFPFLLFFALFVLSVLIKKTVLTNVFIQNTNQNVSTNDYSSIYQSTKHWLSFEGICFLFISACGKCYYLIISSLGFIYFFVLKSYKVFWGDSDRGIFNNHNEKSIYLYLFSSLFLTLGIAAYFTQFSTRIDGIICGRYNECFLAPYLLLGICFFITRREKIKIDYIAIFIISLILSILVDWYLKTHNLSGYVDVVSMFFSFWYKRFGLEFIKNSLKLLVIFIILVLWLKSLNNKSGYVFVLTLVMAIYLIIGIKSVSRVFESNYRNEVCVLIQEKIIDEDTVYYCGDDNSQFLWYVADIQIMNPNISFVKINENKIDEIKGFIITDQPSDVEHEILVKNGQVGLFYNE